MGLSIKHALGTVTRQQYEDEALMCITPDVLSVTSKYNVRLELIGGSEAMFAADFLARLGGLAVKQSKRMAEFNFIDLEGKPVGTTYSYEMSDEGLLLIRSRREQAGYILSASRAIDGFLNSILDVADVDSAFEQEESEQLQLV